MFDIDYPHVECDADQWRNIVQTARHKAGIVQQSGQVQQLLTYLINRRGPGGEVLDWLDVDWETDTDTPTMQRLFFTSHLMMEQFRRYGQFVVMDATCKTNRFNMPLILLVGMDDTETTTIFGMALVLVEDIISYTWVLNAFRRAVGNEHTRHTNIVHSQSCTCLYTVLSQSYCSLTIVIAKQTYSTFIVISQSTDSL